MHRKSSAEEAQRGHLGRPSTGRETWTLQSGLVNQLHLFSQTNTYWLVESYRKKLEVGETWRCGTSEGHTYCDFEQSATLVPGRNENSQDIFLSLKKSHGWWVFI